MNRATKLTALVLVALAAAAATPLRCEPLPVEVDCSSDKLEMTRENPERYEYYLLCIPLAAVDPSFALQEIDPSVQCGSVVHPACRDISEQSCMGQLDFEYPERSITPDKWAQLCELAELPWVLRVVGGYWLD